MGMFLRRGIIPQLSDLNEGRIIKFNESGTPAEFYLACHNYEAGLNGAGRTLIVRKDCYDMRAFDEGGLNTYASSDLDLWHCGTYLNLLDPRVRAAIGTTTIHVITNHSNNTLTTIQRAVFQLSSVELGIGPGNTVGEGTILPIAATKLRVAYRNGAAVDQWTRTLFVSSSNQHNVYYVTRSGDNDYEYCTQSKGSRPAFTLPSNFIVKADMLA